MSMQSRSPLPAPHDPSGSCDTSRSAGSDSSALGQATDLSAVEVTSRVEFVANVLALLSSSSLIPEQGTWSKIRELWAALPQTSPRVRDCSWEQGVVAVKLSSWEMSDHFQLDSSSRNQLGSVQLVFLQQEKPNLADSISRLLLLDSANEVLWDVYFQNGQISDFTRNRYTSLSNAGPEVVCDDSGRQVFLDFLRRFIDELELLGVKGASV